MGKNGPVILALIAALTIVGIFAIMADCSKQVSRTSTDAVEACVKRGGQWVGSNDGQMAALDYCLEPKDTRHG